MISKDLEIEKLKHKRPHLRGQLVYGVGVLDSEFPTMVKEGENVFHHSGYRRWKDMLRRCYRKDRDRRSLSYVGCSVSDEWLSFSNFNDWYRLNFVAGWHLDKDLLINGNRVYSPKGCLFIPHYINSFTEDSRATRGEFPQGVCYHKQNKNFISYIREDGKRNRLGSFSSPKEAHEAWFNRKMQIALNYKSECDSIHPRLFSGLIKKVESMREY